MSQDPPLRQIMERYQSESIEDSIEVSQIEEACREMLEQSSLQAAPAEMKNKLQQLDKEIADKKQMEKDIREHISNFSEEIAALKEELKQLEDNEKDFKENQVTLAESVNTTFKDSLVNDGNKQTVFTNLMQSRLGFKLKVLKDETNEDVWIGNFIFDGEQFGERNKEHYFISIKFDEISNACELIDMQPRSPMFLQMQNLLANTNDVTGLLYSTFKYFSLYDYPLQS